MVTRFIVGSYGDGVSIYAPYLSNSITSTGYVGGFGVYTAADATAFYTLVNGGKVSAEDTRPGVYIASSGRVVNGGPGDLTAPMTGGYGVRIVHTGTVVNYGLIRGDGAMKYASGAFIGTGVVTNGSATDTAAAIGGPAGVILLHGAVTNYGGIVGNNLTAGEAGVLLLDGGNVVNGAAGDPGAYMYGAAGVLAENAAGAVTNFGRIAGALYGQAGVILNNGGAVTNGAAQAASALIEGASGVIGTAAATTVVNFGSILGGEQYGDAGVHLGVGAVLTNGALNDRTALIQGYDGIDNTLGTNTIANFGTIDGVAGQALYLEDGGSLTNGAAGDATALIEGWYGVTLGAAAVVTNFGTISAASGDAVRLRGGTLIVEAGSAFDGAAYGGGGTLDLASGVGVISGLAGDDLTVSGSMPSARFDSFGDIEVGLGATFTAAGTIAIAQTLDDAGVLDVAAALTINNAALVVSGALGGPGTLDLDFGSAAFNLGSRLTVAKVDQGPLVATVATSDLIYAGAWAQSGGILTAVLGGQISFTGAGDSFAGTLAGAGTVAFAAGTATLAGTTLTAAHVSVTGAKVTLSGAIANDGAFGVSGGALIVAGAGATLSGTGAVVLNNSAANAITGATAGATLTVDQALEGAGKLGGGAMALVVQAAGLIESVGSNALTVNTGASTIANAGRMTADSVGGLAIAGAVANAGVLAALAGTLAVGGAVTGTGHGRVAGGTLKFASSFNQAVEFDTTGGTLELAHGQAYAGTLTGFSLTGATALDLDDIAFVSGTTTASYAGTASGGVLTITSGTEVAHLNFAGDYLASVWTLSAGPGGGTRIVDPANTAPSPHAGRPATPNPPAELFAHAMAGLNAPAGVAARPRADVWRSPPPMLAAPGAQLA